MSNVIVDVLLSLSSLGVYAGFRVKLFILIILRKGAVCFLF